MVKARYTLWKSTLLLKLDQLEWLLSIPMLVYQRVRGMVIHSRMGILRLGEKNHPNGLMHPPIWQHNPTCEHGIKKTIGNVYIVAKSG